MNVYSLGWNDYFAKTFEPYKDQGFKAARVTAQFNHTYVLYQSGEYITAEVSGRFQYQANFRKDYPVVGDWVVIKGSEGSEQVIIHAVLTRQTYLARKMKITGGRRLMDGVIGGGSTEEQVLAANIDIVFIVVALDNDFNLQRIERYLTITYNSGATPIIILNKADLCPNLNDYIAQVESVAIGVPIHTTSIFDSSAIDIIKQYLTNNRTVIFVGSSGVGKSSIINILFAEELQITKNISKSTGKGRHTTTNRQLFVHPAGGIIIDTPGIRELQLWCDEDAVEETFEDIKDLALNCKFNDCQHDTEPGCAIKQAIEDGVLTRERFESYLKQLKELERLKLRQRGASKVGKPYRMDKHKMEKIILNSRK